MIRRSTQPLTVWFAFCDLSLTACAWVGAYLLRFGGWIPVTKTPPALPLCRANLPLVPAPAAVPCRLSAISPFHTLRRFREEMTAVLKGAVLLSLFVMATTFYRHDPYESRATMLLFTALTAELIFAARRLTWEAIRRLR